jgi:hypothetical protein
MELVDLLELAGAVATSMGLQVLQIQEMAVAAPLQKVQVDQVFPVVVVEAA